MALRVLSSSSSSCSSQPIFLSQRSAISAIPSAIAIPNGGNKAILLKSSIWGLPSRGRVKGTKRIFKNGSKVACFAAEASAVPQALLFDCDGVLVDTEKDGHRISFNDTFAEVFNFSVALQLICVCRAEKFFPFFHCLELGELGVLILNLIIILHSYY